METEKPKLKSIEQHMQQLQDEMQQLSRSVEDLLKTLKGDGISSPGYVATTNHRLDALDREMQHLRQEWIRRYDEFKEERDRERERRAAWERNITQRLYWVLGTLGAGIGGATYLL